MEILPLTRDLHEQAAGLFVGHFKRLRQRIPELPATLEDPGNVTILYGQLPAATPACAAVQDGRLVGYLTGFVFPDMRGTGLMGAFVPEWGHAALESSPLIYRQLYSAISAQWAAAGVRMHGIALLAGDEVAMQAWYWNGFGLTVVDGIRATTPIGVMPPPGWKCRPATEGDAERLARIDSEHCQHYSRAPVFMAPRLPDDSAAFRRFMGQSPNRVWLAMRGDDLGGFLRFERRSEGAATIVVSEQTIALTGAFVRPQFRGQGLAKALLDEALREYAGQGFTRCSVDFESFNPQAAAFWPRYFHLVTLSAIRVPEWLPVENHGT